VTTFSASAGTSETNRVLAVLSQPESLDAVCRLIGVSSKSIAALAGGDAATCSRVIEQCRATALGVLELGQQADAAETTPPGEPALLPESNLQELLGCPVTLTELDGCVAQILERGRENYLGEVSCETTTLPEVEPALLVAVPACFGVVLRCPELLSLGELFLGAQ
jgi:hypothetical protein